MARLGDILNTRTEVPPSSAAQLPPIKGRITLDGIHFRYRPEAAPVLGGVSLHVHPGEVIGIVARHFAAHRHRFILLYRRANHVLQQLQHRRVVGLV